MREKVLFGILFSVLIIGSVAVINVGGPGLPKVYVDPANITDLGKGAGKYFAIDVNVADVTNLWSYDFYIRWDPSLLDYASPPPQPIQNMNFTDTASTAWVTSTTVTSGTPTNGYDAASGNPLPGSGAPSYYHRATSTGSQTANIAFETEQSFEYGSGLPSEVSKPRLSYAYAISGNSIGSSTLSVTLVKPDSSTLVLDSFTRTAATSWTYKTSIIIEPGNFTQRGTYKLRFKSVSTTSAVGTANYIQVNWDDVGLKILTASVVEGPFLKQGVIDPLYPTQFYTRKNQTEGWIYVTNTLTGTPYVKALPVSGNGTLATFTFKVEKLGSTILDLYGTVLRNDFLEQMSHTVQDGYFSNKMAGDANGDRSINAADLPILAAAFGAKFGEAKYDVRADFNGDESIDIKDLHLLGRNYSKSY